jgi:hypothetical protein
MKIKSNLRAGSGGSVNSGGVNGGGTGGHSSQAAGTVGFYLPPVSRCVGI